MSCKFKKCNNHIKTEDGFCHHHGYYSTCDNKYIVLHIKEYLGKIESALFLKRRIDISLNLWYYLIHKKDFILKHSYFHTILKAKGDEIIKQIRDYNEPKYKKRLNKFINFHLKIKKFS